jgi:hypothetical protein
VEFPVAPNEAVAHPHTALQLLGEEKNLADWNRALSLDNSTLGIGRGRTLVALDHVHALDNDAGAGTVDAKTLPVLPLSLPAMTWTLSLRVDMHHSTSGASEMIFMNRAREVRERQVRRCVCQRAHLPR